MRSQERSNEFKTPEGPNQKQKPDEQHIIIDTNNTGIL